MEIKGFENYLIYEDGRVYSKNRNGRFLKPVDNGCGYLQVLLCKDGKKKNMLVSRLVALHYIPNHANKEMVDHIDRNRLNNNINNLRWVTASENSYNRGIYGAIPFKGVCKNGNGFCAMIRIDSKLKYIGTYNTPELASDAYNKFCNDNKICNDNKFKLQFH